jgi:hypothetical protein
MAGFFSRLKGKDGPSKVSKSKKGNPQNAVNEAPPKPRWEDAWTRKTVEPEEVQELLRGCTVELKSRGTRLIDMFPLLIMHDTMVIFVALHVLIAFSHSSGYAIPYFTLPTDFRPERGAYFHSSLLR